MEKVRKNVNLDAMVKSFIQNYNIPTKQDIDQLNRRLDRMEKLIRLSNKHTGNAGNRAYGKTGTQRSSTASEMVLDIIKENNEGTSFKDILNKSGFEEKKIRNIVYRLHTLKRIKRLDRGLYIYNDDQDVKNKTGEPGPRHTDIGMPPIV